MTGDLEGDPERPSDDSLIAPVDWQRRLSAAVAATVARRAARRQERAEFKRRRDYGLAARHRAKLAREAGEQPPDDRSTSFEVEQGAP